MYRRRNRNSNSNKIPLSCSNRGSDISPPNNTSLIVQRSRISEEPEEDFPKSVTALLYDDEDDDTSSIDLARPSSSVLHSMTQKTQSTPQKKSNAKNESVLREFNSVGSRITSTASSDSSFLQERFHRGSLHEKSKTVTTNKNREKCLFLLTLSECGAEEVKGEQYFRLSEDQAVFSRKLDNKLQEGHLEKFSNSLKDYLDNDKHLEKLLILTQTSSDCDVARGPVQEPMLRLLLLVDCLQTSLLHMLLDRIANIIKQSNAADLVHLISGILRHVRCLGRVQNTKFGSKLFDLIEGAPLVIQKEVIFLIPDLIVEEEQEDASTKLVELLHSCTELTPVIINSLGNLPLTNTLKEQVRQQILSRLDRYSPTFLPSLVQFVVSRSSPQNMPELVMALRDKLPFNTVVMEGQRSATSLKGKQKADSDSHIQKTFENIKSSLMSSKSFCDAWFKAILSLTDPKDMRCVDLMVIVLIYGYVLGRKSTALTLIKNRIRGGILLETYISKTFKVLRVVAIENHKEVLELSSALLKSFETPIADIAITIYQELFAGCGQFLRQDVISDLVMNLTTGSPCTVNNAMNLLARMRETDKPALEAHASTFMTALRVLTDLDLALARQLVDLVASLVTAPSQQDSGLIEELSIFIRKQMSAWQQETQRRGVVAAISTVKHAALRVSSVCSQDVFESNFLLKMAGGAQSVSAERRGFFFDELASMLRETDARPEFLVMWADRVFNQALEHVFASNLDLECEHFPMSLQYSIENSENLVLPIVAFAVKPQPDSYINAKTIPAALRLLWCAEKDLSRISGMVCAAVILPDTSVYEKFMSFSVSDQKMIMDCLFLCANYFIECVNALSTQKGSEKLVIRLKQLIEVRKLILQHVVQIPDYTPPPCQFHIPVAKLAVKKPCSEGRKPGKGKKRKSDGTEASNANQTHLDSSALPATSAAAPVEAMAQISTSEEIGDLFRYVGYFRELHCHAYKLLRMELKLNPSKVFKKKKMSDLMVSDVSWSYRPEDKPELGPSDTLFLLQDYLSKAEQILRERPWFLSRKPSGLVTDSITPSVFILGSAKLLPKLCLKLDVASSYCRDLLEANDGVWDAPGCFPKESADIKMVFCALLKIIVYILTWRGFQSTVHENTLKEILFILARKSTSSSTQAAGSLAMEAARYLMGLSAVVPLLSGGVSLTRAVQACIQFSGSKNQSLIGQLCGEILQRPWFTLTGGTDRGVAYNQQVDILVRMHLTYVDDRLVTIQRVAELAAEEVPGLLTKDSPMPTYAALNKGNFPLLYRAMCEALVTASAEELRLKSDDDEACIAVWSSVTRILMLLVDIAKVHSSRTNLAALLKRSQAIIQQFLGKGIPVMEAALRVKSDEVLKVLKSLQAVTRFLHSVCCHSKMTNDAVVAAHVPNIRALCERLTLEVKGMLILNKIPLDCITIAVLKNKDIQGNDIMSQSTVASDDESELPDEETDPTDPDTEVAVTDDGDTDIIF